MKIMDQVRDIVGVAAVFGEPYEKNGLTIIPASKLAGAGGGGGASEEQGGAGAGIGAAPVGAFVIKGESVTWVPAIDVTRIVIGSQILMLVAILAWRSVAKARARQKRH